MHRDQDNLQDQQVGIPMDKISDTAESRDGVSETPGEAGTQPAKQEHEEPENPAAMPEEAVDIEAFFRV